MAIGMMPSFGMSPFGMSPMMGMGMPMMGSPMMGMGGEMFQQSPMTLMLEMYEMSMMMSMMSQMSQYGQNGMGFPGMNYPGVAQNFPGSYGMGGGGIPGGYGMGGGGIPGGYGMGGGGFPGGYGGYGMPASPYQGSSLPAFPPNGNGEGCRAVDVAQSQVGVVGGEPQVCQYTNGRSEPWCADFVSFCYQKAGGSPFGHQPGVEGIRNWGQQHGLFHNKGQYRPRPGDVVIFGDNQHTGIVEKVDPNGTVHTIEGNTNGYGKQGGESRFQGAVARHALSPNSGWITGYVDMQKYT